MVRPSNSWLCNSNIFKKISKQLTCCAQHFFRQCIIIPLSQIFIKCHLVQHKQGTIWSRNSVHSLRCEVLLCRLAVFAIAGYSHIWSRCWHTLTRCTGSSWNCWLAGWLAGWHDWLIFKFISFNNWVGALNFSLHWSPLVSTPPCLESQWWFCPASLLI